MSTVDLLKILNNKIDTCKDKLSNILNKKGVLSTTGDTLSLMVDKVDKLQNVVWNKLGYFTMPEAVNNGYYEACKIYNNWDANVNNFNSRFRNNKNLMFIPNVSFINAVSFEHTFENCYRLIFMPRLQTDNIISMKYAFGGCSALEKIEFTSTKCCTNFRDAFSGCSALKEIPYNLTLDLAIDTSGLFSGCENLTKIEMPLKCGKSKVTQNMFNGCKRLLSVKEIDLTSSEYIAQMFDSCSNLRYLYIKNLGAARDASRNELDLSETKWGVDGDGIVGAKQSVLDTFNGAFNRASAGYPTLRVIISEETNALITPEEKSAFESKGYLLVV